MIVANLQEPTAGTSEQLAYASTRGWYMTSTEIAADADALITLRAGRVVGAYQILTYSYTSIGRVHFKLESTSRLAFLVGQPAPFGVSTDPDFALCVSTDLVLDHAHGRRPSFGRRATKKAAVGPFRQQPTRERPRAAGTHTNAID